VELKRQVKLKFSPLCITVTTRADRVFYFATTLAPTAGGAADADGAAWLAAIAAVPGVLLVKAAAEGAGAGSAAADAPSPPPAVPELALPRADSKLHWPTIAAQMAADADGGAPVPASAPAAASAALAPAASRLPPGLASARSVRSGDGGWSPGREGGTEATPAVGALAGELRAAGLSDDDAQAASVALPEAIRVRLAEALASARSRQAASEAETRSE